MTGHGGGECRAYLVSMPLAEARHLAGISHGWPALPQDRLAATLREWLAGLSRRRGVVQVCEVVTDLTRILGAVPLPQRIVRLDEEAISSLAGLAPDDDFHVKHTAAGPVLSVGAETYLVREEEPGTKL